MASRRKKSKEVRETERIINASKRFSATMRGLRTHRVSFNTDELTSVIATMAYAARYGISPRDECFAIAKRMWPYGEDGWLKNLFFPTYGSGAADSPNEKDSPAESSPAASATTSPSNSQTDIASSPAATQLERAADDLNH